MRICSWRACSAQASSRRMRSRGGRVAGSNVNCGISLADCRSSCAAWRAARCPLAMRARASAISFASTPADRPNLALHSSSWTPVSLLQRAIGGIAARVIARKWRTDCHQIGFKRYRLARPASGFHLQPAMFIPRAGGTGSCRAVSRSSVVPKMSTERGLCVSRKCLGRCNENAAALLHAITWRTDASMSRLN